MGALTDTFRNLTVPQANGTKALDTYDDVSRGSDRIFGAGPTVSMSAFGSSTARKQLEAYGAGTNNSIDWVADALEVITETASSAEWRLIDPDTGKAVPRNRAEAEPNERVADPYLVGLLERPNPWLSWEELVELVWIDWYLTGDAFLLKYKPNGAGQPLALYRLDPGLVEVEGEPGPDLISGYKYSPPGKEPFEIDPEDIIHWRRKNPHDDRRGAGVIASGPRVFDQEVALTETKTSYFENGARLSGVLESDAAIGDSLVKKIRAQFAGVYAGTDRAFQVAVLQRGLHFKPLSATAAEAEFAVMTRQSRDRILAKFRVPKAKLGLPSEEGSDEKAEDRRFANEVMRPGLNKFQTLLTIHLTRHWGYRFEIEYEYQMPIEEQIELAEKKATLPGILLREVRKAAALPPLKDVMEDQAKAKKLEEMVLNLPGENDNKSKVKDRPLGSEPGRPPNGENTAAFDEAGTASADAMVKAMKAVFADHPDALAILDELHEVAA